VSATFAREVIRVQRATIAVDTYERKTYDWTNLAADFEIQRCTVQPIAGSEMFDTAGQQVISRWRVAAPGNPDIRDDDRIIHAGETYDIDGAVRQWPSPSGRLAHAEIMLKRVS